MKREWLVSLMVVTSLGALHAPALASDTTEIQGTWLPGSGELGGRKYPEAILKTMKLVLKDARYTVTVGDQTDAGTVKLDPDQTPKAMDVTGVEGPNAGKTFPAIYELKGDTLRICYNLGGQERPVDFKTEGGGKLFLVTYQRQKP